MSLHIYLLGFSGSYAVAKPHIDPRASLFVIFVLLAFLAWDEYRKFFQKKKGQF